MSSAESFALMMAQCPQVVTMGERSAGSSANPRRLELACGITVNLPRWMDLDPDGKPIERIGIAPDVPVEAARDSFTDESDPVLKAALERLRSAPASERRPGRR
jgi:C-terminal processing protease CtpA/Prc